jgi:hypothetical protein
LVNHYRDCLTTLETAKDPADIDEKQVKAEERYDGIWVLRTNSVHNSETVAHVYRADVFYSAATLPRMLRKLSALRV